MDDKGGLAATLRAAQMVQGVAHGFFAGADEARELQGRGRSVQAGEDLQKRPGESLVPGGGNGRGLLAHGRRIGVR